MSQPAANLNGRPRRYMVILGTFVFWFVFVHGKAYAPLRMPFGENLTRSAIENADLIAAGTAVKIVRRGVAGMRDDGMVKTQGRSVHMLMHVDRVFKGPPAKSVTVE